MADECDPSADRVIHALAGHDVGVVRFSLADVPTQVGIAAEFTPGAGQWDGALAGSSHTNVAEFESVRAVYYRRPEPPPVIDKRVPDRYRMWAQQQALAGTLGVLYSLPRARWVNHPERALAAAHKPVQLHAAAEAGLTVPRTLITTDADAARLFVKDVGEAVCKPVASMMMTHPVINGGVGHLFAVCGEPCMAACSSLIPCYQLVVIDVMERNLRRHVGGVDGAWSCRAVASGWLGLEG